MALTHPLDNNLYERGFGNWEITLYNPQSKDSQEPRREGPFKGYLNASKDFHTIYLLDSRQPHTGRICLAHFPSQNVACAINKVEDKDIAAILAINMNMGEEPRVVPLQPPVTRRY